jgi:hypothetical protein
MRRRDGIGGSVGLAAVLIFAAGCGSASAGVPAPSALAAPAPSRTPASPDPTAADTARVCGALFQQVTEGASAVGSDLGAMVGHVSGANTAAAGASRDSALHKLTDLATRVRSAAAPAMDPGVRSAANQTASRLESMAADPNLLAGVQSTDQVTPVIAQITGAADPLTTACS